MNAAVISSSRRGLLSESDPGAVARYLLSFEWKDQNRPVFEQLVSDGLPLWLEILRVVPQRAERGRLLELGSPPFDITLLVQRFRNYDLTLSAAAANGGPQFVQELHSAAYGEQYRFECTCFDIEHEPFPFSDASFDVVMCCEVIEHLTENPVFMLSEIHRVLKPGGAVVISTPNVARAEHLAWLACGGNIYDPYHLGTPFRGSRHSREYTLADLLELVRGCGFRIEIGEGRNIEPEPLNFRKRPREKLARLVARLLPGNHADYLFVRAIKEGPFHWCFPDQMFDGGHLIWYLRVRDAEIVMGRNDVPHTTLGWGPLESGPDGKPQRRAGPVGDAFLVSPAAFGRVVLDVAGGGVEVQVWQGERDAAEWLETGRCAAPAGRWTRLKIPMRGPARAGEPIHLRVLAPAGVYVHRLALE